MQLGALVLKWPINPTDPWIDPPIESVSFLADTCRIYAPYSRRYWSVPQKGQSVAKFWGIMASNKEMTQNYLFRWYHKISKSEIVGYKWDMRRFPEFKVGYIIVLCITSSTTCSGQQQNKHQSSTLRPAFYWGNPTVTGGFSSQIANSAGKMSILSQMFKHRINYVHQKCQTPQITKFMGSTWGPTGSCRPQVGPMLALLTLLSGAVSTLCNGAGLDNSRFHGTLPLERNKSTIITVLRASL